jgi:hypothetical protein
MLSPGLSARLKVGAGLPKLGGLFVKLKKRCGSLFPCWDVTVFYKSMQAHQCDEAYNGPATDERQGEVLPVTAYIGLTEDD